MKVQILVIALSILVLTLVHAQPRRSRSRYTRPSRQATPISHSHPPPRKRTRTILEATIDGVLDYYSRQNKRVRRPRPVRHQRRPHAQSTPLRDSREVEKTPAPPPATPTTTTSKPQIRTQPPSRAPPPTLSTSTPSVSYISEPKPTKVFKFDLTDAKPTKYTLLADTPVVHGEPEIESTSAPSFYLRHILDNKSRYNNGEIFPEEITNSLAEFGSIAGSDDVGDIAPFSYFSQPVSYVGNQVQYETVTPELPPAEVEPKIIPIESTPAVEFTPEEIPSHLQTSDEVYYPEDEAESDDPQFYYYEDDYTSDLESEALNTPLPGGVPTPQPSEQPVSYYYKDLPDSYTNHGESVAKPYLSYPSYPPLAPAPPKVTPSNTPYTPQNTPFTPLNTPYTPYGSREPEAYTEPPQLRTEYIPNDNQYLNEVQSSNDQNSQFKRDSPILTYKSAYTSQDFNGPSEPKSKPNAPQTLVAPDGSVFYLEEVSEDDPQTREVFNTPDIATPSPVYYKYPQNPDYPRQETRDAPQQSAPKVPQSQAIPHEVYYREVQQPSTAKVTPSTQLNSLGIQEISQGNQQNSQGIQQFSQGTPKSLPLQQQTPIKDEFSGDQSSFEVYQDDATSESKTTVSFNAPQMRFEIPSEFRTFLNTPPRWINLENW